MNALPLLKSDMAASSALRVTRSRDEAIASVLEGDEVVFHEHAADPQVQRAASELIRLDDLGRKTDIVGQGKPYDVLVEVAQQLIEIGASSGTTRQIFETLEGYITGLGVDFTRQAKAKPLYARIIVTDKEPEDLPDCKIKSVTCVNGQRIQGDDASRVVMQYTLYGTRTSMSNQMSMGSMFERGKGKQLLIYFGTIEGNDLNQFDSVDADLATMMQALGADGAMKAEEIKAAIQNGTLPPQMAELIQSVAALNRLIEASRTPGAVEKAELKITELKSAIAKLSGEVAVAAPIPPALAQAIITVFEQSDRPVLGVAMLDAAVPVVALNDNEVVAQTPDIPSVKPDVDAVVIAEVLQSVMESKTLDAPVKEAIAAELSAAGEITPENLSKYIASVSEEPARHERAFIETASHAVLVAAAAVTMSQFSTPAEFPKDMPIEAARHVETIVAKMEQGRPLTQADVQRTVVSQALPVKFVQQVEQYGRVSEMVATPKVQYKAPELKAELQRMPEVLKASNPELAKKVEELARDSALTRAKVEQVYNALPQGQKEQFKAALNVVSPPKTQPVLVVNNRVETVKILSDIKRDLPPEKAQVVQKIIEAARYDGKINRKDLEEIGKVLTPDQMVKLGEQLRAETVEHKSPVQEMCAGCDGSKCPGGCPKKMNSAAGSYFLPQESVFTPSVSAFETTTSCGKKGSCGGCTGCTESFNESAWDEKEKDTKKLDSKEALKQQVFVPYVSVFAKN